MKIKILELENFKGIKHETFHLNGKNTVFFGMNGTGKSTALRGVNVLLSRIIQKVTHNRYRQDVNIEMSIALKIISRELAESGGEIFSRLTFCCYCWQVG